MQNELQAKALVSIYFKLDLYLAFTSSKAVLLREYLKLFDLVQFNLCGYFQKLLPCPQPCI